MKELYKKLDDFIREVKIGKGSKIFYDFEVNEEPKQVQVENGTIIPAKKLTIALVLSASGINELGLPTQFIYSKPLKNEVVMVSEQTDKEAKELMEKEEKELIAKLASDIPAVKYIQGVAEI